MITILPCEADDRLTLSLPDGLRMSLGQNLDLRVESFNRAISEAEVARSRGIYDPVLGLTASGGGTSYARDNRGMDNSAYFIIGLSQLLPTGGTIAVTTDTSLYSVNRSSWTKGTTDSSSSATIELTQPLLKNAGQQNTELVITLAENARDDAVERYKNSALDTVSSFLVNYYRLFTLRQMVQTKEQSLEAATTLLADTGAKLAAGTATPLDVANAEYGVAFRRKDLVDAERAVRDQESVLRYVLGIRDRMPIYPTDPPDVREPEESEDKAVQTALEMRPDIRQLRLALKISELQERVARNQTLPDFNVTVSATSAGSGGSVGDNLEEMGYGTGWWQARGQLSFPIGNTAARNEYRKAKLRTEQLKSQITALETRIDNDVRTDMRGIISARLQLQVAKKSAESAEVRLAEYKKNLAAGTTTAQEVLEAEADLSAARNSQVEAAEGFSNAVTKLWRDMGVLLERKGITFYYPGRGKKKVFDFSGEAFTPASVSPAVPADVPAPAAVEPVTVLAVAPVAALPAAAAGHFAARFISPEGAPLAEGTTVHDLDGKQWAVGPGGVVVFDGGSRSLVPVIGRIGGAPCWAVAAPAPGATPAETVCHPVQ